MFNDFKEIIKENLEKGETFSRGMCLRIKQVLDDCYEQYKEFVEENKDGD